MYSMKHSYDFLSKNSFILFYFSRTTFTSENNNIAEINNTIPTKTVPIAINVKLGFNRPTSA